MRSIKTPPKKGMKSPGRVMTMTCPLTFTVECVAARVYHRGKRSELQGTVWQAAVGRDGFARNERNSLSRRVPAEDSFLHDQIGESLGRRTALADCRRPRGFPSRCGCREMAR